MDGDASSDNQNMYKPDEVVTPDKVAVAAPVQAEPSGSSPLPAQGVAANNTTPGSIEDASSPDAIRWTASEFIAHSKSANWYLLLGLAAVLIATIIWLLTRDWFATGAVAVGILLLFVYAGRQPRQEQYMLDGYGITIGGRHHAFSEFRSFAVIPEGAFMSIEFTPLQRLATYTTVYCAPDDESRIVALLSEHLPMSEPHASLTDSLMRRIHF